MDYVKSAKEVLEKLGGKENLISAAHCATRLRLVIVDNSKCDKKAIENVEGVKGVFEASGQLQVIFGTGIVNKVFEEFIKEAGIEAGTKDDVKKAAANKGNFIQRAIKLLGDIFVPIIPAIVASGLLMGLVEGIGKAVPGFASSDIYTMLDLFANAAFTFLPILIAISAAKAFGANVFLGAVIGMIMIHPSLTNAWSASDAIMSGTMKTFSIFGLYEVNQVGYQGHVIPVVIAVFLLACIEKKLHKIVPEIIDLFVTPLVSVMVTGFVTIAVIGPVFAQLETWVLDAVQYLVTIPFGIGAMVIGALYAVTVVAGLHHMYNAIEAGMISATGKNIWMPIATAANVAQGAAALAVAVKTKNQKVKAMALPASLSAFLGITEPAIFGVNVRYQRPFIAGIIGGACGALVGSVTGVYATAYGITGVFGVLITTETIMGYLLTMAVSAVVAFIVSWILGIKEDISKEILEESSVTNADADNRSELEQSEKKNMEIDVLSVVKGNVVMLEDVPDETFAKGVLGPGVAVVPEDELIKAPFDGKVVMLADSKHAIGLESADGVEILIHVGLETVGLDGKPFECLVEEGQAVKKGQELLKFNKQEILSSGCKTITPVIVTNYYDYKNVSVNDNKICINI